MLFLSTDSHGAVFRGSPARWADAGHRVANGAFVGDVRDVLVGVGHPVWHLRGRNRFAVEKPPVVVVADAIEDGLTDPSARASE